MRSLARKLDRSPASLEDGEVIGVSGGVFVVRAGDVELEAKRARSCLVAPRVGDEVLVATSGDGRAYVLAVLEGDESAPTTLEVDGDLELRAARLGVRAPGGVDIASGKQVAIAGAEFALRALEGSVVVQKLSFVGGMLRSEVGAIKTVASTCDSLFDRVSQRVKRSFRFVEDVDQVKAHSLHYAAETTMSLRAENAMVTAEELVKIDGGQIQLG